MSKIVLAAVHGILTSQTDTSWPDKLQAWMLDRDYDVLVLKKEYCAGPLPRWNNFWKNPRIAKGLAAEIQLYRGDVWLVAHSNGAVIALMAAKMLIKQGRKIGGLILTGAACDGDVKSNGIAAWRQAGNLGKAIAYSSPNDKVVSDGWPWSWLKWPYGSLGRTGWRLKGKAYEEPKAVHTRWFKGNHSCYFTPEQIEATFEQIYQDIRA
jgi:pimeloyl-ACP methyl ester carboxylesterase